MTPRGADRLIVALDLPSADEAIGLAVELSDCVRTFKVGLEMCISGEWLRLVRALDERVGGRQFFLDLKLPGDIPNTISRVVQLCKTLPVKFLTLSESVKAPTVAAARAGRGTSEDPKFLAVVLFSSVDERTFHEMYGPGAEMNRFIVERSSAMIGAGCDGLIVSGEQIGLVRKTFPGAIIVSPGIRPPGYPADDQRRVATPTEALRMGADYLVVGRPITASKAPLDAARQMIDEIDAFDDLQTLSSAG